MEYLSRARGGGDTASVEYFTSLPFSLMPHFSTLVFLWGGCSPVLHGLILPNFQFSS